MTAMLSLLPNTTFKFKLRGGRGALLWCGTAATTMALTLTSSAWYNRPIRTPVQSEKKQADSYDAKGESKGDACCRGYIEANLMDKIARKPYLQPVGWKHSSSSSEEFVRPNGVPKELRVIVIDLPEFRQVFDETCKVDLSSIFPDGIARPKKIQSKEFGSNTDKSKEIVKTSEIVQKSLAKSLTRCGSNNGVVLLEMSISDIAKDRISLKAISPIDQYAWFDELRMRMSGAIPFGDVLERSSLWNQYLFGNSYRWKFGWFYFWKNNSEVEERKPHAVIVDGKAVASVPGALNELVTVCRGNKVPLWVINDPRVWIDKSVDDLESAARSMRNEVKKKMIMNALWLKEGSTFERGRRIGRTETELKYAIKNTVSSTKSLVKSINILNKSWKNLSKDELKSELRKHGVCEFDEGNNSDQGPKCIETFVEICRSVQASNQKEDEHGGMSHKDVDRNHSPIKATN